MRPDTTHPEPHDLLVRYLSDQRLERDADSPDHHDQGVPDLFPASREELGVFAPAVDPRVIDQFAGLSPTQVENRLTSIPPSPAAPLGTFTPAVDAFIRGDRAPLTSVLDPQVKLRSDAPSAEVGDGHNLQGRHAVVGLFDALMAKRTDRTAVLPTPVNGLPGVVVLEDGMLDLLLAFCPADPTGTIEQIVVLRDKTRLRLVAKAAPFGIPHKTPARH